MNPFIPNVMNFEIFVIHISIQNRVYDQCLTLVIYRQKNIPNKILVIHKINTYLLYFDALYQTILKRWWNIEFIYIYIYLFISLFIYYYY